jgi:hypothetical protein
MNRDDPEPVAGPTSKVPWFTMLLMAALVLFSFAAGALYASEQYRPIIDDLFIQIKKRDVIIDQLMGRAFP